MAVMWNRKVFIRIIEVLLCIACVVALRVTDDESRRVFHYLRNRSREWSILNNVTWGSIGAALATATCGGYIIITTGLLIAAVTGELTGRVTELFLLGLGIILFGIVGSLSLASIESVPDALIDNAAVLGALCLLTCLVFIADILMGAPRQTKQQQQEHQGTTFLGKETAVKKRPTISLENESKMNTDNEEDGGSIQNTRRKEASNGRNNEVFKHSEERSGRPDDRHGEELDENPHTSGDPGNELFAKIQRPKSAEVRNDQRQRDENQSRECATQNLENVQTLKDSRRYGGPERDTGDDDRRFSTRTDLHQRGARNFRDRPEDELDTPLFPRTRDTTMPEPMFAQIVNPSVKIMRVEHDSEETFDTRNSDSSHYDNVPTRMAGNPDDILKRHRDVSFNIPSPMRTHVSQVGPNHDDIEMLEEWINVLKTTTGTKTRRSPSSPTDPGYVKHTANNWPKDLKSKTPGSSPDTRK